jgi:hypothetical protein
MNESLIAEGVAAGLGRLESAGPAFEEAASPRR